MNQSSIHNDRKTVIDATDDSWPRDFDFREAYAEQQELLEQAALIRETPTQAKGAERND